MAISAEQLNVILSAKDKEFTRAMDRSQRRVQQFAKQSNKSLSKTSKDFTFLASAAKKFLPALGASLVISQLKAMTNSMDEIGKKADQIGMATGALQELSFVAEGAGVSQGKFTSSMERFSKRLGEAEMGTGAAKKALKELGLEASDLTSMNLDSALGQVADKMSDIDSPTRRAALAAAIFGREGVAMVNMLGKGSGALDEMRAAARDAGAVIDDDLIRNAEEAQTRLDAASRVISAQLSVALADLVPIVVAGAEGFASLVKNVVGGIQAVERFLKPQSDLEIATDNLVMAMADEITQSQRLESALGRSTNISVVAAKQKLAEAQARHQNAQAAIAEQRAIALNSNQYSNLLSTIEMYEDSLRSISSAPDTLLNPSKINAYEQIEADLVSLRAEQQAMLDTDKQMSDQFALTETNIAALEDALANAKNGMVSFGDEIIVPITATERLAAGAAGATTATQDLINNLASAGPALSSLGATADEMNNIMGTVESSMESAFMSMIDGTASASDAFKSMAGEIIKELYRVLVVQRIVGAISGAMGGFFNTNQVSGPAMPLGTGNIRPPQRASGGPVSAGQAYVTGEHGRELFVPKTDGRILSGAQTSNAARSGGDGVTIIQNNTFGNGVNRAEVNAMLPKLVQASKAAVLDAKLRGGSYGGAFS
jgi:hypothetical protein